MNKVNEKMGEQDFIELPQQDAGDPLLFQKLLEHEKVPVPEFLRPTETKMSDEDIPVARYISREFHLREMEKLWLKTWQFVAREEQVSNPGDHIVYDIGDQSIIVVRGDDGVIRGFYNSCLHRGRALRNVSGTTRELRCPFHGFTWSLEGAFKSLPCAWDFEHLKDRDMALPQVRVESWAGFVFINFDEHAPSLQEYLEVLPDHFAAYFMDRSCTADAMQNRPGCIGAESAGR